MIASLVRKRGRVEPSHGLGSRGPGRGAVLLLSSIVAVSACGDDATEPIVGDAARVRIEAIAAADPRVGVVEGIEYDLAGESCEDTYGTFRDADPDGFGLELLHRPASDEEVEMLVGIVARTATFCPEFAAEVGESASRALVAVQRGNPDPFSSQHLDDDLGERFVVIADDAGSVDETSASRSAAPTSEASRTTQPDTPSEQPYVPRPGSIEECLHPWVHGIAAPVRCEESPDAFTKADEADMLCPLDDGLDGVVIATGLESCDGAAALWRRYVEWDGPLSGSSGSAEFGDGWTCATTSAAGQAASGGLTGECFSADHARSLYVYLDR